MKHSLLIVRASTLLLVTSIGVYAQEEGDGNVSGPRLLWSIQDDVTITGIENACLTEDGGLLIVLAKHQPTVTQTGEEWLFSGGLLRLDHMGSVLWEKNYPQWLGSVVDCGDGGFIIGGETASSTGSKIMKIDAEGKTLWEKSLDWNCYDNPTSIFSMDPCRVFPSGDGGAISLKSHTLDPEGGTVSCYKISGEGDATTIEINLPYRDLGLPDGSRYIIHDLVGYSDGGYLIEYATRRGPETREILGFIRIDGEGRRQHSKGI